MLKHFCDVCGKELDVSNTALSDTSLIERDLDGLCNIIYRTKIHAEICEDCAFTLCRVMIALKEGKEVIYK